MTVYKATTTKAKTRDQLADADAVPVTDVLSRIRGTEQTVALGKAGGRPMLNWVGKRAPASVQAFPAQWVESYGNEVPRGPLWQDWPQDQRRGGLLYHGDNKEVLAHLLANGFRGKVKLVYIDPPFDSGADYVRKVQLRGPKGKTKLDGEGYTLGEQIQYTDIWANDNYLQFMYERLLLIKELMDSESIIVLHCDWKKSHHLRCIMDEVFGSQSFQNEVYWYFYNKMHDDRKGILPRATNTLLVYGIGSSQKLHKLAIPRENLVKQLKRVKVDGVLENLKDADGKLVYQESDSKTLDNVWGIPLIPPADHKQKTDYPTQKPEALLDLVLHGYTNPGDLVLDAFIGSGTTAVSAQRLGRRWIGCDINKGAIHTTTKRLQRVMVDQEAAYQPSEQVELLEKEVKLPVPAQLAFSHWRINDYDLAIQHNEAVALVCEYLGVVRLRSDSFFDGLLGKRLIKIIPFGHPLSPVDLEAIRNELESRPEEDRAITVVCLGKELAADAWLADWNRLRKKKTDPHHLEVIELRSDPKYGGFLRHEKAQARLSVKRKDNTLYVKIEDFVSPSILARIALQSGVVQAQVSDWRAMVDSVMIDPAYNGAVFNIVLADVPAYKTDLVSGEYALEALPDLGSTTVAVKITDMLGEEVLVTRDL